MIFPSDEDRDNVFRRITSEPIYIEGKNEILKRAKDYETSTHDERLAFWNWFDDYIDNSVCWKRKHLYAFYRSGFDYKTHPAFTDDFAEYMSGILGECHPTSTIALKSDPEWVTDLYDYVHDWPWICQE